MLNIVEKIFMN